MADQRGFAFSPARHDIVSFARMGFDLDWRHIQLRAGRLFAAHLRGVALEDRNRALAQAFAWRQHFLEVATYEAIREACRRKGRELKRANRAQGKRLRGETALACTAQGRRAQRVIDELSGRLSAWEAASLCG